MSYCDQCGNYHEPVTVCGRIHVEASAPPIAERDTREMLNLIADQLRALEKSLKERQDQDREATSSWISTCEVALSSKLDRIDAMSESINNRCIGLHKRLNDFSAEQKQQYENLMRLIAITCDVAAKSRKKASKSRK